MKKHFKALSSRALAGLVLAFAFGAATLAGAATNDTDPTPYATPSVNTPDVPTPRQAQANNSTPCQVSDSGKAAKQDKKDKDKKEDKHGNKD